MTVSALSLLSTFNLITTGDASDTAGIQGSAIIGGNLTGTTFFANNAPAQPVVYLYGTESGRVAIKNGGTLFMNGPPGNNVSLGNGSTVVTSGPPAPLSSFTDLLTNLSTTLGALPGNSSIIVRNGTIDFEARPNSGGEAVFNITAAALEADMRNNKIVFNLHGATGVIVNVTGNFIEPGSAKWNGPVQRDVLFNFVNATTVTVDKWRASILAPNATVHIANGLIDGSVFAKSFTGGGKLQNHPFAGTLCYLPGTQILTVTGERAIETLAEGDLVVTVAGGVRTLRPVKWVGYRRIDLAAHPRPDLAAPVLIKRSAIADNVPHRDLFVSPDHAICIDDTLFAARQLINGATIVPAPNRAAVDYIHLELDAHAVVIAEGLTAESYLDTGNRGFFANGGQPTILHPDLADRTDYPSREAGSCLPFVWQDAAVQPVWQRLADRAAALGQVAPAVATTTDPALCLEIEGQVIRPINRVGAACHFVLPAGTTSVRLVSRAAMPASLSPWLDDRRLLGVNVERITLHDSDGGVAEVPMDHPDLAEGWWSPEPGVGTLRRWTNGTAALSFPAEARPRILKIALAPGESHYAIAAGEPRLAA